MQARKAGPATPACRPKRVGNDQAHGHNHEECAEKLTSGFELSATPVSKHRV